MSFFWSKSFLLSRPILWMVFLINLLGTVYGYYWYWGQLVDIADTEPLWYLPFVPDSPTASLFFTLSLVYLMFPKAEPSTKFSRAVRGFIEAFAVITSIKYGIWAVTMIVAGAYLGDPLSWQHFMLIFSHLGMAFEVLLFGAFYRYGMGAVLCAAAWTLWNDFMDYNKGIFPYLSHTLLNDLDIVKTFTISLSFMCIVTAIIYMQLRNRTVQIGEQAKV
ncbi:DUF1405 domain-containing protein [Paenibacillus radicibacter]|uniref:DUF1405 domain-containing protein n=1 Tax=Paenibacillus radicibacter TaxID=2972488 RepID=UPI00280BFC93|nr:DUF1405 domain-containing protein [Paenibacillus radicibacter]